MSAIHFSGPFSGHTSNPLPRQHFGQITAPPQFGSGLIFDADTYTTRATDPEGKTLAKHVAQNETFALLARELPHDVTPSVGFFFENTPRGDALLQQFKDWLNAANIRHQYDPDEPLANVATAHPAESAREYQRIQQMILSAIAANTPREIQDSIGVLDDETPVAVLQSLAMVINAYDDSDATDPLPSVLISLALRYAADHYEYASEGGIRNMAQKELDALLDALIFMQDRESLEGTSASELLNGLYSKLANEMHVPAFKQHPDEKIPGVDILSKLIEERRPQP